MKQKILFSTLLIALSTTFYAQVGVGTVSPDAALDITSTNDGVLIPRIALTATNVATVITPTTSELVYNTATAGAGINAVTPGFYYWNGSLWVRIDTTGNDWATTGNTGTTAGTNYVGTTDAQDLRFKTQGTDRLNISNTNGQLQSYYAGAAGTPAFSWNSDPDTGMLHPAVNELSLSTGGTERVRIDEVGAVGIGTATPQGALDITAGTNNYGFIVPRVALTASNAQAPVTNPQTGAIPAGTVVYNTATAGAAPNNVAPGLYFWNGTRWVAFAGSPGGLDWTLTGNASTVPGTYSVPGSDYLGTSDNTALHIGVNGLPRIRVTTSGNVGIGQSSVTTTRLIVDAIPTTDSAFRAQSTGSNSGSIIATASITNTAPTYANALIAYSDQVASVASPNFGIRAASGGSSFIGPVAQQNIAIGANATNLAFYGITEGTTDANRRAAEFRTNDAGSSTDSAANDPIAYLAGYDDNVDVDFGGPTANRDIKYGGYFYGGNANAYAYVGVRLSSNFGGTSNYKILGPGTVSTIVASDKENESKKIMFAPEAPEVLFEDYGTASLVNGIAEIKIDPIFAKNIYVDEKRPLKVFIQLEGDCNGVYVTNKSKNGFTVKELQNGRSNVSFSWHIVGNRADEVETNGEKTTYQSLRFPDAPIKAKEHPMESKLLKKETIDSDKPIK